MTNFRYFTLPEEFHPLPFSLNYYLEEFPSPSPEKLPAHITMKLSQRKLFQKK